MLVQFTRENGSPISINPADVAVLFGAAELQPAHVDTSEDDDTFGEDDALISETTNEATAGAAIADQQQQQGHSIVRFRDGRGFKLRGGYATTLAALGAVNLVEFVRDGDHGNIAFNPNNVAAIFGSEHDSAKSLVRLPDGRGFKVVGSYEDTHAKLANAGLLN